MTAERDKPAIRQGLATRICDPNRTWSIVDQDVSFCQLSQDFRERCNLLVRETCVDTSFH